MAGGKPRRSDVAGQIDWQLDGTAAIAVMCRHLNYGTAKRITRMIIDINDDLTVQMHRCENARNING